VVEEVGENEDFALWDGQGKGKTAGTNVLALA